MTGMEQGDPWAWVPPTGIGWYPTPLSAERDPLFQLSALLSIGDRVSGQLSSTQSLNQYSTITVPICGLYFGYTKGGFVVTKVQKWGNSQGIRLRKETLSEAEISVGDEVEVSVAHGVLVVKPIRRQRGKYDLRELVRQIPKGYRPGELDWGPPAGREVW